MRELIVEEFLRVLNENDGKCLVPILKDDTVLLETGLDSLGFAILVTRLESRLGYDPFSLMEKPYYPVKFKDFVDVYEKFRPIS
ncbi:MAG: acyl carrier protein [Legionella sp.]|jgi:hypothetical protein